LSLSTHTTRSTTPDALRDRSHAQKPRYDCTMKSIQSSIRVDPEILSGTPVFDGTRVPVQTLMDYLKVGDRVDDFLDDFPTVSREQIAAVLDVAGEAVTRYARIA